MHHQIDYPFLLCEELLESGSKSQEPCVLRETRNSSTEGLSFCPPLYICFPNESTEVHKPRRACMTQQLGSPDYVIFRQGVRAICRTTIINIIQNMVLAG